MCMHHAFSFKAKFSPGDARKAPESERQGEPLEVFKDAMHIFRTMLIFSRGADAGDSAASGGLIIRNRLPSGLKRHQGDNAGEQDGQNRPLEPDNQNLPGFEFYIGCQYTGDGPSEK